GHRQPLHRRWPDGGVHLQRRRHARRAARTVPRHRQRVHVAAVRDVALRLGRAGRWRGPLLRPSLAAHAVGPDAAATRRVGAMVTRRGWRALVDRRAAGRVPGGHAALGWPGTAGPPTPRAATGAAARRRPARPRDPRAPRGPASTAGARSRPEDRAPAGGGRHALRPAAPCPRCPGTPRRNSQGLVRRSRPAAGATRRSRAPRTPPGTDGARRAFWQPIGQDSDQARARQSSAERGRLMASQVICECGYVMRDDDEDQVVALVRDHIRTDHPELLHTATPEMIRTWIEIIP